MRIEAAGCAAAFPPNEIDASKSKWSNGFSSTSPGVPGTL